MRKYRVGAHTKFDMKVHLVWVPKYRYRVLTSEVNREVSTCIHVFSGQKGCDVVELNVQPDHVHLIVMIPPKVSISVTVHTFVIFLAHVAGCCR